MERPSKRRRLSDGGDEEEFDLCEARARNNLKLKSRFESIFEKYGQDFSNMGDEIDLKTGAIVVNNGHLEEMQDEQDIGRAADGDEPEDTSSTEDPEFDWIDHSEELEDTEPSLPPNFLNMGIDGHVASRTEVEYGDDIQHMSSTTLEDPEHRSAESEPYNILSSFLSNRPVPAGASKIIYYDNEDRDAMPIKTHAIPAIQETPSARANPRKQSPIEPLWQTPEIEGLLPARVSRSAPMYTPPDRATPVSPSGGRSLWAGPWTRHPRKDKGIKRGPQRARSTLPKRKSFSKADLQALRNFNFSETGVESDDSDDPLQDDSYSTPVKRPSPSPGVVKRSTSQNTPSGSNQGGKDPRKPSKEESTKDETNNDCVLQDDDNNGVYELEQKEEPQAPHLEPAQSKSSKDEGGENELISSEATVETPVPASNTPLRQKSSAKHRVKSSTKINPSQRKENGVLNAQHPPDKEKPKDMNTFPPKPQEPLTLQQNKSPVMASPSQQKVKRAHNAQLSSEQDRSNDIDPFDNEFDNISTTSGLSSMQIEPSPVKTPLGKRGFSSPLAARSSAKERYQAGRFSSFAKRPIKVPIFRRP